MSYGICRVLITATVALALLSTAQLSFAQIEEITVLARKRAESLQNVPISVQAVSGEEISSQGLYDLAALAPYTPNFSMVQAPGASDLFFMRGLGTYGSGVHFEPSVGQVFNGYFSTRSRLSRTALIDVAQVEVLKGPQGAIIGKNTSLGALNITSNRPTEDFEAAFSAAYNFEASEGYEVQGVISGPLSDNVRGRVVVDYQDVDGWVDNLETGELLQMKQDLTLRAMLDVDFTDSFSGEFLYQFSDLDRNGKAREATFCFDEAAANAIGLDCNLDGTNNTQNLQRSEPGGALFNPGEPYTSESNLFGATFTWSFDNFDLTSLTNLPRTTSVTISVVTLRRTNLRPSATPRITISFTRKFALARPEMVLCIGFWVVCISLAKWTSSRLSMPCSPAACGAMSLLAPKLIPWLCLPRQTLTWETRLSSRSVAVSLTRKEAEPSHRSRDQSIPIYRIRSTTLATRPVVGPDSGPAPMVTALLSSVTLMTARLRTI